MDTIIHSSQQANQRLKDASQMPIVPSEWKQDLTHPHGPEAGAGEKLKNLTLWFLVKGSNMCKRIFFDFNVTLAVWMTNSMLWRVVDTDSFSPAVKETVLTKILSNDFLSPSLPRHLLLKEYTQEHKLQDAALFPLAPPELVLLYFLVEDECWAHVSTLEQYKSGKDCTAATW